VPSSDRGGSGPKRPGTLSDAAFDSGPEPRTRASARPLRATVHRVVETQYVASTLRLVDSAEAQAVLEAALEASKPPVPADCAGLDYLLYTPFRYPPTPWPSRFRGPSDPGVFYAAERDRTALAEVAHWRLKVLLDAVDLSGLDPTAHTLFSVVIEAVTTDVSQLRPSARRRTVLDPDDYTAAQAWGRGVRAAGYDAIRYASVRDRPAGVCWAVLAPSAFRSKPRLRSNWSIRVSRAGAYCRSTAAPFVSLDFPAAQLLCRE
jgi:hypothetical protein